MSDYLHLNQTEYFSIQHDFLLNHDLPVVYLLLKCWTVQSSTFKNIS